MNERHREKKRRISNSNAADYSDKANEDRQKTQRNPGDGGSDRHKRSASLFSDPLEEIIGPATQTEAEPRTRGRGTTGKAAMDSRFLDDYDPALDGQTPIDEDRDDFEDALEAYRDRQKWKQQGAQRLRNAGLSEDFIKAWEDNDTQNPNNIRWTKKGGTREWDRGKVAEDDSSVDLRADWIKGVSTGSTREWDRGKVAEDDSSVDLRADWIKGVSIGSSADR